MKRQNENCNKPISSENVQRIGEKIATIATKTFLAKTCNERVRLLYRGLLRDCYNKDKPNHHFSDGYDLAQEAICFLCENMGKTLDDLTTIELKGKVTAVTVRRGCYAVVGKLLRRVKKDSVKTCALENVTHTSLEPRVTLEGIQCKDDWSKADKIIEKLNLLPEQLATINCYLAGMGYIETARTLGVSNTTIWYRRKRIQEKYYSVYGKDF